MMMIVFGKHSPPSLNYRNTIDVLGNVGQMLIVLNVLVNRHNEVNKFIIEVKMLMSWLLFSTPSALCLMFYKSSVVCGMLLGFVVLTFSFIENYTNFMLDLSWAIFSTMSGLRPGYVSLLYRVISFKGIAISRA